MNITHQRLETMNEPTLEALLKLKNTTALTWLTCKIYMTAGSQSANAFYFNWDIQTPSKEFIVAIQDNYSASNFRGLTDEEIINAIGESGKRLQAYFNKQYEDYNLNCLINVFVDKEKTDKVITEFRGLFL